MGSDMGSGMRQPPRIVVVGSINMDLLVRAAELPRPGETVLAESMVTVPGGKGANQAVAAARAGGVVSMIGRVGEDVFSERLREALVREGVQTDQMWSSSSEQGGVAIVAVDRRGRNSILVVPGANGLVSTEDIEAARPVIQSADLLLVQLEIPMPAVERAVSIAREARVACVLDPAPAPRVLSEALYQVNLLCPNESEAAMLVGQELTTREEIERVAEVLARRGASAVAITCGERGTCLWFEGKIGWVPAVEADVRDTTGAGDAFAGALAVRWAEGIALPEAVRFANAAGSLAVSRVGTQDAMATREEINQRMAQLGELTELDG